MNAVKGLLVLMMVALLALAPAVVRAEPSFRDTVGSLTVGPVTATSPLVVPYITWGGDVATFHANGGLATRPDSLFARQGLNLKLVAGDDFVQQVRDYVEGKTPFLRGTMSMVAQASEVIGSDPRTKGVVVLQLTWSKGDHMVVRPHVKTIADLRGKKIALQSCGPHVGMLDDILKSAKLGWDDVRVVWCKDLTASASSPAEVFRKDPQLDACFVISPDMAGLTGGLQNTGSGAEGTVKGARVLVSTDQLSRSIADVYVVRKDFYDAQRATVLKFVAGYLKACEEIVDLKKQYESKGSPPYTAVLKLAQDIYGKQTLPTLEADAHGLLCDATFVGHPGNVAFFTQKNNVTGFEAMHEAALNLAVSRGFVRVKTGLFPSGFDYDAPEFTKYLTKFKSEAGERFRGEAVLEEIEKLSSSGGLDDRTIVSFTINFEPNQTDFSAVQYGAEYQRVVEMSRKYGNAVFAIRGHADPTKTLLDVVQAGMAKGFIKRAGSAGSYQYSFQGRPLELSQTGAVVKLIQQGDLDGVAQYNPRQTMQAALNLSRERADAVRDSVIQYAASKSVRLDKSQIQPVGVGITEPFIAKPSSMTEARQNMRVEFRLIRVTAEAQSKADFDF